MPSELTIGTLFTAIIGVKYMCDDLGEGSDASAEEQEALERYQRDLEALCNVYEAQRANGIINFPPHEYLLDPERHREAHDAWRQTLDSILHPQRVEDNK